MAKKLFPSLSYGQKSETMLCVSKFFIKIQKFKSFYLLVSKNYSEVRLDPTRLSYKTPHK